MPDIIERREADAEKVGRVALAEREAVDQRRRHAPRDRRRHVVSPARVGRTARRHPLIRGWDAGTSQTMPPAAVRRRRHRASSTSLEVRTASTHCRCPPRTDERRRRPSPRAPVPMQTRETSPTTRNRHRTRRRRPLRGRRGRSRCAPSATARRRGLRLLRTQFVGECGHQHRFAAVTEQDRAAVGDVR